jgi:hypothetical protein
LQINEKWLSKTHFKIERKDGEAWITDLGSTNGTFVNGVQLNGSVRLCDSDVIRAGRSVCVFHHDGADLISRAPGDQYGLAGRFHVAPLVKKLEKLAASGGHVLLAGPTGSGKELAAHALAEMTQRPLVVRNAGQFGSEDEAAAALFGVLPRVFTNVDERVGLIRQANQKVLFLDETHILPIRIQKSLLRVIEDGLISRIGETKYQTVDTRFVFASNESPPNYGLAHDLVARLRVVEIPPLSARVADIPTIFRQVAKRSLERLGEPTAPLLDLLSADHFEILCLHKFPNNNVRGLISIANDIADEIKWGSHPETAIKMVFDERFPERYARRDHWSNPSFPHHVDMPGILTDGTTISPDSVSSEYTPSVLAAAGVDGQTLDRIKQAHTSCKGVIVDMVACLRETHGIRMSRQRVSSLVDLLGLARVKRRRPTP